MDWVISFDLTATGKYENPAISNATAIVGVFTSNSIKQEYNLQFQNLLYEHN